MNITTYIEDKKTSEFYPTPEHLAMKMLDDINWNLIETVLEPSAGKGDILKAIARAMNRSDKRTIDIDAIEIDDNLRSILKFNFSEAAEDNIKEKKRAITERYGRNVERSWHNKKYKYYDPGKQKEVYLPENEQFALEKLDNEMEGFFEDGIRIVHDDFLTYQPYKEYDLIVMNPPFSNGDKHLLKALEVQKNGGSIVCLLNAETIRNPYTESRKSLVKLLDEYNADIEYIENAFADAERKARVDVALIKVCIPKNDNEQSIFEKLARTKEYSEPTPEESMELEVTDFIQAAINRYKVEVESGIELIKVYKRMLPYLCSTFDKEDKFHCGKPIIALTDGKDSYSNEMTINKYVKAVRLKYWTALLSNEKFIGKLTSKLQEKYRKKVSSFSDYDFSEFNIRTLTIEMNSQIRSGVEEEIEAMYDRLTEEHSYYPECRKNRHLYDGWKTNKAWKIDKKVIVPCYGVFSNWNGESRTYEAYKLLADIERILNFFDGNMTAEIDLNKQLELNFRNGITKNVQCKFFSVTFYKKGTAHIVFTCPELIDRFNIYAAQSKKWLPPSYGKKQYKDMTNEEKAVIDSFQGKAAYENVMKNANYYLAPVMGNGKMLQIGAV